ncbi:hypothetical protein LCGC14_0523200 [marine sediment metagenome]|uniref:Nuclease-associated modular DNA-binding 1 domain-containing protein n=1 Tax=marine sediment metagenome TaxID=412755 RepID=A0A0F9S2R7_9ZZZZ
MDKLELEKAYHEYGTITKTAKHFGCSHGKIRYQLDKHKINYKLERNTSKISKDDLEKVYKDTQSVREAGRHFNMSHEKARRLLVKYGLCNKLVRYNCDHNFFSEDSQHSFYWAGFIAADGAIIDRRKTLELSIGLAQKDKNHIQKFKQNISAENPIHDILIKNSKRNPNWNDCWKSEIKITSNKLCKDLERFNVVPRKSKIYTFPEWLVNHELTHHFMRGYFDGDGSFFYPKLKEGRIVEQLYFGLRGTSEFLTVYRTILERKCNLTERAKPIRVNNGIGVLEYGGNGIMNDIVRFLYKDADIYLERKRDIIKDKL